MLMIVTEWLLFVSFFVAESWSYTGPRIWNNLPASLRQPDIEFGHFKRLVKAFLFGKTAAHSDTLISVRRV